MGKTYSVKDIAKILGYSTNTVYSLIKNGEIKTVRLGRGRIRITHDELDRITKFVKNGLAISIAQHSKPDVTKSGVPVKTRFRFDSFFDWFIGVEVIILGFSLGLYSSYINAHLMYGLAVWINVLRIVLIFSGTGIILRDGFLKSTEHLWHRFFHLIIFLAILVLIVFKVLLGDIGGAILFSTFAVSMVLHLILGVDGWTSFIIYDVLYVATISLTMVINPILLSVPKALSIFFEEMRLGGILIAALAFCYSMLLLWVSRRKEKLFFFLIYGHGIGFVIFSFWFVNALFWDKAFFIFLSAIWCWLIPIWDWFLDEGTRYKKIVTLLFASILIFTVGLISVIWIIELNTLEITRQLMVNKIGFNKVLFDSTIESILETTKDAAANPLVMKLVEKKDKKNLDELLRVMFQRKENIRRMYVLGENGDLLSIYPYIELTTKNFAFRDYFEKPKSTGKPYVSDMTAARSQMQQLGVLVSVPIASREGGLMGVFVSSVNLEFLGKRLQEVANQKKDEEFWLLDRDQNVILRPPGIQIQGKRKEIEDFTEIAPLNVAEFSNSSGQRVFVVYVKTEPNGWIILMESPVLSILKPTGVITSIIFALLLSAILIVGIFVRIIRLKIRKVTV